MGRSMHIHDELDRARPRDMAHVPEIRRRMQTHQKEKWRSSVGMSQRMSVLYSILTSVNIHRTALLRELL